MLAHPWQLKQIASGDCGVDRQTEADLTNRVGRLGIENALDSRKESRLLAVAPPSERKRLLAPAVKGLVDLDKDPAGQPVSDRRHKAMFNPIRVRVQPVLADQGAREGHHQYGRPKDAVSRTRRGYPTRVRPRPWCDRTGLPLRMASARQSVHTSWQARLRSPMTMKGRFDAS